MKHSFIVGLILLYAATFAQTSKICHLKGIVTDPEIKGVVLKKIGQDVRFDSLIHIPVIDKKISYDIKLVHDEAFELILESSIANGPYIPLPVFAEKGDINIVVNPEKDFNKNVVKGGKLNSQYNQYKEYSVEIDKRFKNRLQSLYDSVNSLDEKKLYYSVVMYRLMSELKLTKSKEEQLKIHDQMNKLEAEKLDKCDLGQKIDLQIEKILNVKKQVKEDFITKNPSLVGYYLIINELIYDKQDVDLERISKNLQILTKKHPNHPYNKMAANLVNSIRNIKIGNKFTDFSAPNLNGELIKLSDVIGGKITVLNLWGTWCSSCIVHSRLLVPIYNEFKDKGFTVISVAGEFKNTKRLESFFGKEKWPWINLVELERQNKIWQKYGVDNEGGGVFLIDPEGKILAINPSAEEVRTELVKRLN